MKVKELIEALQSMPQDAEVIGEIEVANETEVIAVITMEEQGGKTMKAKYAEEATDNQVNWGSGEDPRKHLVVGETYETSDVEVHSSIKEGYQ